MNKVDVGCCAEWEEGRSLLKPLIVENKHMGWGRKNKLVLALVCHVVQFSCAREHVPGSRQAGSDVLPRGENPGCRQWRLVEDD